MNKNNRSLPITTQSQSLFMLEQAKLRAQSNILNDNHSPLNGKESKYNPHLLENIDQVNVNRNVDVACNRQKIIPTKYSNKSKHPDNNIALYNIRDNQSINNQYAIGNILPERLKALKDTKVMTPNAWMKDYAYIDNSYKESGLPERFTNENNISDYGYGINTMDGNYNGYMSQLLTTSTNKPDNNIYNEYLPNEIMPNPAMFPDQRLQQNMQTQERQFKDRNARIIDAENLRYAEYIKERNKRQIEADNYLNHNGKLKLPMNRHKEFVDDMNNKLNNTDMENYIIDNSAKKLMDKNNERNNIDRNNIINRQQHIEEDIDAYDQYINDMKKNSYEFDNNGKPIISTHHKQLRSNNIDTLEEIHNNIENEINSIQQQKLTGVNNKKTININSKQQYRDVDDMEDVIEYRYNSEMNSSPQYMYTDPNTLSEYEKRNHIINEKERFNQRIIDEDNYQQRNQEIYVDGIKMDYTNGIIQKEAFNKSDHILVMKDGNIKSIYTNPNDENVCPVLITMDVNNRPIKTIVTKNNKTIYILQKRDPLYIDPVDGTKYDQDYIGIEIPLDHLDNNLRKHIEANVNKHNNNRSPSKIVELEYDDFVQLSNMVERNMDKTKRIKVDSLKRYFQNNDFDNNIINGYEPTMFTTPNVITESLKNERMKTGYDNRIQKDISYNEIDKRTKQNDSVFNRESTYDMNDMRMKQFKHTFGFEDMD